MERFFIRTKDQEGFVESEDLQSAFVQFVKETPLELLGAIHPDTWQIPPAPAGLKPQKVPRGKTASV